MDITRNCVLSWYGDLIDSVNDQKALKDAKSRLQEWLQSKQFDLPTYELMETRGNAPNQIFVVRCHVNIKIVLILQSLVKAAVSLNKKRQSL